MKNNMKTIRLTLLTILLGLVTLTSCNKEKNTPTPQGPNNGTEIELTLVSTNSPGAFKYFYIEYYDITGMWRTESITPYNNTVSVDSIDFIKPLQIDGSCGYTIYYSGGSTQYIITPGNWSLKKDGVVIDTKQTQNANYYYFN